MSKSSSNHKAKRKLQADKNKAKSQWVNREDGSSENLKDNPLFLALLDGTKGTFAEDTISSLPQLTGIVADSGHEYAFMYGKDYSIPDRNFIGKTFEHKGKFYLASWTELLHPSTVKGGLWVVREYDHLPTDKEFNGFLLSVMMKVVPFIETSKSWFFDPIVSYNMRLLGMDTLPDEHFTVEQLLGGLAGLIGDLKSDGRKNTWTHHV